MVKHKNLKDEVLGKLRVPQTLEGLATNLRVSRTKIREQIANLRRSGHDITNQDGTYFLTAPVRGTEHLIDLPMSSCFALLGDTHLGSKYEKLNELHNFHYWAQRNGAQFFLHVGDLIQGVGIYATEAADLKKFTMEDQIAYFVENYPSVDIPFFYITGNHDLKSFEKGLSPNPARNISSERPELAHIGDYYGRLRGKNTKITIDAIHPATGQAYARSYNLQKYIENSEPGEEPSVLASGHTHDVIYIPYRGVHAFKTASFQGRNPFSLRKGLANIVGGWLVEIEHDRERINTCKAIFKHYDTR